MTDTNLRYGAAACQTDFPLPMKHTEIRPAVDRMLEMIDFGIEGYAPFYPLRLFVFPEFAHTGPAYHTLKELHDHLAMPIPNEHTERYIEKAKEQNIYIQTGSFLEKDDKYPGAVFNTTVLIGPDGILSRYRKINPFLPLELHTSPHDIPDYEEELFPVADTPIGKMGAVICYDWLFPENLRQLAFNGAEILIRVSAYMEPFGPKAPMDWWTVVNRCRALENMCYVVASNQGATMRNFPPYSWPGGSMVVDFDGRILTEADPGSGERIVVGPIDLAALRAAREYRTGHTFLQHLRPDCYRVPEGLTFPKGTFSGNGQQQAAEPAKK